MGRTDQAREQADQVVELLVDFEDRIISETDHIIDRIYGEFLKSWSDGASLGDNVEPPSKNFLIAALQQHWFESLSGGDPITGAALIEAMSSWVNASRS